MCPEHGEGCQTLLRPKADASQIVGIYLMVGGGVMWGQCDMVWA